MNNKKILSVLIAAALAVSPMAVFAQENVQGEPATQLSEQKRVPSFVSAALTVEAVDGKSISLKDDKGEITNLNIADYTLIIDSEGKRVSELKKGDSITYYVNANRPAPLIYPALYNPDVIVVNEKNGENKASVKVDIFTLQDGQLTSLDGELIVNIDPTVLERADGGIVTKEALDGQNLCVIYSMSTMSIPPQTNPDKVYILNSAAEPMQEENISDNIADTENSEVAEPAENAIPEITGKISANGGDAFEIMTVTINGRQMLPVRAVSEALGLDVAYDGTLEAITVGTVPMGVSFNIGTDSYSKARMMPFILGQAPIKVIFEDTGVTYVPAEFFTEVLGAQISIDNGTTLINLK